MKLRRHGIAGFAWSSAGLVISLVTWEAVSRFTAVNPLLLPPPTQICVALIELVRSGELLRDVTVSLRRASVGFAAGLISGVAVGLLTARYARVQAVLAPLLHIARALPPVAIIPLVILWFGIGDFAKIWSIAFAVFFPVWVNTLSGASRVAPVYVWAGRSLGFNRREEVFRIILPASMPFIVAGIRNGVAVAFVMVFVSELAGADSGLGFQIAVSQLAYRVDRMIAALLVLATLAAVADLVLSRGARALFPWLTPIES
ncbi:MAG: ABC transporter permease [Acidobacteriota bacterium]|nr:ABC transporter permease [Acidobacteriota bacterium]